MNFQFLGMKKQLLGSILTLFITNLATQMKAKNNCFINFKENLEVFASGKRITKKFLFEFSNPNFLKFLYNL